MNIKRIVIVGLGSIGQRHLRLARELLPDAEVRVLRHKKPHDLQETSNDYFFNIIDALNFKPQLVIIANPAPFHVPVAQAFAEIGTHLLIEKPLSDSINNIDLLLETCRQQGCLLLTGYNLRFLSSLQYYRQLLETEIIGNILSIRCEIGQYLPSWRPNNDYRESVSAKRELGGGALLELSHELDYLRWLFGEVDWVQATLCKQSNLDIDVEDTAHLTLGLKSNANKQQIIATVNLDFIRHDTTRLCTAIGENGSLRWNALTGEVLLYKPGGDKWHQIAKYQHQRDDSYIAEWQHIIECIDQNQLPLVTGEDGLKVLEIIEAARISSKNNKKTFISELITR